MSPPQRIDVAVDRLAPYSTAVDILERSLTKVLASPNSERYRKVSLDQPTMRGVSERPGAMELLHATGWERHYSHLLLNTLDKGLLETAVAALRRTQATSSAYACDHQLVQREAEVSREKAKAAAIEEERRRGHAAKVPAEPPEGAAGAAKICIHLNEQKTIWRRFDSTVDTLRDLVNFVKSLEGAPESPRLQNITQLPACTLDVQSQLGLSLHFLDLWPAGHVRVLSSAA